MKRAKIDRWRSAHGIGGADGRRGRAGASEKHATLLRFPVQNILVHAPGGGIVQVVARYGYTPLSRRLARIREWRAAQHNSAWQYEVTDIRTDIPVETRLACPLDWSGCVRTLDHRYPGEQVYNGLHTFNIDYDAVLYAVETIRSVHGVVPVDWNLRYPWGAPRSARPLLDDVAEVSW